MGLAWYLVPAGVLLTTDATMVPVRRSAVIALIDVEMTLNAANLVLATFARINPNVDGGIMAFLAMVVAAVEVVIGLSIIVLIYRSRSTISIDDLNLLKNWRGM